MMIRDAHRSLSPREKRARMNRRGSLGIAVACLAPMAFLMVTAVDAANAGAPDAVLACTFLSLICAGVAFLALCMATE